MIYYSEELSHHGIKGQKWGIRKERNASNATKNARIKKAAKIGAIVAATALAAYGGYKLHKIHGQAIDDLSRKYKREGQRALEAAKSYKNMSSDALSKSLQNKMPGGMEFKARHYAEEANRLKSIAYQNQDKGARYLKYVEKNKYPKKEVANQMLLVARGYKTRRH